MEVETRGQAAPVHGARVIARPNAPACAWYGGWAILLTGCEIVILATTAWDGGLRVLFPSILLVLFGIPLFAALRQLTTTVAIEPEAIQLRRLFRQEWALKRQDVWSVQPTFGIVKGGLRLIAIGSPVRVVPAFLARGMRGTWVNDLRHTPMRDGYAAISREAMEAMATAALHSSVETDPAYGDSPKDRWKNWARQGNQQRYVTDAFIGLLILSFIFPRQRGIWVLDVLLVLVALALPVRARLQRQAHLDRAKAMAIAFCSLGPGIFVCRGQFFWRLLDPGFGTIACWFAGIVWVVALMPPLLGVPWKERARYLGFSLMAFGAMAFWGYEMLAFANMHFGAFHVSDAEMARVLNVEEHAASRSTPATVDVELDSPRILDRRFTAQFTHDAMPAGQLVIGGRCALLVRSGLLNKRWLDVAACTPR